MLDWLKAIMDRILGTLQAIEHLGPPDAGIRVTYFIWWMRTTDIGPGWYIWHPWFQYIETVNVKIKGVSTEPQSATTKDGHEWCVGITIAYSIFNARKALLEVEDYEKTLMEFLLGLGVEYVSTKTKDELLEVTSCNGELQKKVHAYAKRFGIRINDVWLNNTGKSRNLRVMIQ